jgi:hypothetical protein
VGARLQRDIHRGSRQQDFVLCPTDAKAFTSA